MNDRDTATLLDDLAPEVRESAAKDLFERRRSGRRQRRRAVVGALGVLLVVGAVALISRPGSDGEVEVVAGPDSSEQTESPLGSAPNPAPAEGEIPFVVIAEPTADSTRAGTKPIAAANQSELDYLWRTLGMDPQAAVDVDLDQDLVLAITVPGSGCRSTLTSLRRSSADPIDEVIASTQAGSGQCTRNLALWTTVVTIHRSELPDEFGLVVPTDPQFGYDDASLLVSLDPSADELPGTRIDAYPSPGVELAVVGVASDDTLNLRSGPGTEFNVVAEVLPISSVVATGHTRSVESGVWTEIDLGGGTGWANTRFLTHLAPFRDITAEVLADESDEPPLTNLPGLARFVVDKLYESPESSSSLPDLTVVDEAMSEGTAEITVDLTGAGDDSAGGSRLIVTATPQPNGMFELRSIRVATHCTRGLSDDGLCL